MAPHPVAPDLIPHFPQFHSIGFGMSVSCAHGTVFRCCWTVTVFDPRCRPRCVRTATLNIHGDRRLGSNCTRELNELISPEVAGLLFVLRRKIYPRRAFVARTNSPHPPIILRNVATGPTDECWAKCFDFLKDVATNTVNSVARKQRELVYPNSS